ncbi:hypothetical protein [Streptomyces albipurpureus]|nr:hypothetical protein [Streptomyces sp. CWNU-1]
MEFPATWKAGSSARERADGVHAASADSAIGSAQGPELGSEMTL